MSDRRAAAQIEMNSLEGIMTMARQIPYVPRERESKNVEIRHGMPPSDPWITLPNWWRGGRKPSAPVRQEDISRHYQKTTTPQRLSGGSDGVWSISPVSVNHALSSASYAAMLAQGANAPVSALNMVRSSGVALAERGREIADGSRAPRTSRAGKATDRVASRVAATADAIGGARRLAATPAAQLASKAMTVAGKAALPLLLTKAAIDAAVGFQKGGLSGAVLGAVDSVAFGRGTAALDGWQRGGTTGAIDGLTFGMMTWAAKHAPESLRGAKRAGSPEAPPRSSPAKTGKLEPKDARRFEAADRSFETRQAQTSRTQTQPEAPETSGLRGFQNQGTLQAALAAQGKEWSGEYDSKPQPGKAAR